MANLYVIGDSFSAVEHVLLHTKTTLPYPDYDFGVNIHWPKQLADKLNINLINLSQAGVSQDFQWAQIYKHQEHITSDDYVIIVLTESSRFWYLYNRPNLGRPDLILQDPSPAVQHLGKMAEQFDRYLNRDALSVLNLENRLGALSYMAHTRGWRKPLVVYAMNQMLDSHTRFNNLEFANGTLTDISIREAGINVSEDHYNDKILKGIDPRYNHLTMSNHKILVNKLYDYFINKISVDLTTEFLDTVLTEKSLANPNFLHELSPGAMHWRNTVGNKWKLWKNFGKEIV
jgi:hypothetical protein